MVGKNQAMGCVAYRVVSCFGVVVSHRLMDRARGVPLAVMLVAASGTGIICYTVDNMEKFGRKKTPDQKVRGLVDQLLDQG